jgi:Tfp pilus assembly protein PilX
MIDTRNQRGISLVMSLIMLVVLSMIAISATYSTNSSLRIVGNMQRQDEARVAAQMAIDDEMSSLANFTSPAARDVKVDTNRDGAWDYNVHLDAPTCVTTAAMTGSYSAKITNPPQNTYWQVRATVTEYDATTSIGSQTTVYQGVKILLLPYMGC